MEIIAIGLLATAALVFVAYPLVSPKRQLYYLEDMLGLGEQKKLNYLYSKRNLVHDNIKDLENEFAMGKLSEADFSRLRDGLLLEAKGVLAEIESAHIKREVEDLIEADARERRRIK